MSNITFNLTNAKNTGVDAIKSINDIIQITANEGFKIEEGATLTADDGYGGEKRLTLFYNGYLDDNNFKEYKQPIFNEDRTILTFTLADLNFKKYELDFYKFVLTVNAVKSGESGPDIPDLNSSNFIQIIKLTDEELRKLIYSRYDDIYNPVMGETGITYPPLQIGNFIYKAYNIDIPLIDDVDNKTVYFGLINTGYKMDMLNYTVLKVDLGKIKVPDLKTINNNIYDIELRLYLPYLKNYITLDRKYNNEEINIMLHVNLLEGNGVYNLIVNNLVVECIDVDIGNSIPIYFKQDLQLENETRYKERIISTPYLQIYTKRVEPIKVNNFKGLVKHSDNIDLVGKMNSADKQEIKSLISQGIIIK